MVRSGHVNATLVDDMGYEIRSRAKLMADVDGDIYSHVLYL